MKVLTLKRTHKRDDGIFGVLDDDGVPFSLVVENAKLHIPKGEYVCNKSFFNRGGYWTFEITGVPNRTRILFHKGNYESDSLGCLILGEKFSVLDGKNAIAESAEGFNEFVERTRGLDQVKLVIQECS